MSMFCFQCEQTMMGRGCGSMGKCGKDPGTAALQDLIVHAAKGLAQVVQRARELEPDTTDKEIDGALLEALFATLTNVNFDQRRLFEIVRHLAVLKDRAREQYEAASRRAGEEPKTLSGPAAWQPAEGLDEQIQQGAQVGIVARSKGLDAGLLRLQELVTYALKGLAAYAYHAKVLGFSDPELSAFIHKALSALAGEQTEEELVSLALEVGEKNLRAMELLDMANTEAFGHPEPTEVRVTPVKGKAILVSGHDLDDLRQLLEQTEGKGINVYTHGEMLPAHGYPKLKRFPHLKGNYGGAWQNQMEEFHHFPGAILVTSNCLQFPATYRSRLFTCGPAAWPGVIHISDGDFSEVIEAALAADGFAEDGPEQTITVGFARNAVLGVADKVVQAIQAGQIRHLFLIGGCDGAKPGRDYYTELAENVPDDCLILTLGCGKYRFNKLDFGEIDGIPRLLDVGQCNDAYSAIQIALALSKALDTEVNELPLSLVLSWYEQKAVAILLSLLHLGIKKIRLGPSLPAFLPRSVLESLSESHELMPTITPEEDLAAILGSSQPG